MSGIGCGLTADGRVQVVGVDNLGNLWQSAPAHAFTGGAWAARSRLVFRLLWAKQ